MKRKYDRLVDKQSNISIKHVKLEKKEAEQSQNTLKKKQVLWKEKDTKVLKSKLTRARAQKDKYYKLYLQANRSNIQLKE